MQDIEENQIERLITLFLALLIAGEIQAVIGLMKYGILYRL